MTPEYLLGQLFMTGTKLRNAQKAYFKEKDPVQKKVYLSLSKRLEQDFDTLLQNTETIIETWKKEKPRM